MRWGLENRNLLRSKIALLLSIIALFIALISFFAKNNRPVLLKEEGPQGLLDNINKYREIHVGYGVYPPYTMEDPNTGKVSGFSAQIIEEIGAELECKIVWHRINWNTLSADLKRGEYDVIADPIFQTIPRAREFAFSEPYAYFADGIAVVRKDESRFTDFSSLDQRGIVINVGQGWASETLVKFRFNRAIIRTVQTSNDLLQVFNDVVAGRADVAIADGPDAQRFVLEHPTIVKALWLDSPPARIPAGFALRPSDREGAEFLTVCLRNLESIGLLDVLAQKFGVTTIGKQYR